MRLGGRRFVVSRSGYKFVCRFVARSRLALLLVLGCALALGACAGRQLENLARDDEHHERLWAHRNLGKALYENPATQYEAVDELRLALELDPESVRERVNLGLALLRAGREDEGIVELERAQRQDPSIPHTWFNLGIAYKRTSRYDDAIAQLQGMLERVPDEPISHYNLGVLYKLQDDRERALQHLERAAQLAPALAGPQFQLANSYRQAGRVADADAAMARFRAIKAVPVASGLEEDLEWSWYSELYETIEPEPRAVPEGAPVFVARTVAQGIDAVTAGLVVLEADGVAEGEAAPRPELLVYSASGVQLVSAVADASAPAASDRGPSDWGPSDRGLASLRQVRHVAAGDVDNDGLADLAVISADGVAILMHRDGAFAPLPAGLPVAANREFDLAIWVDWDHDHDPDLLLLGEVSALLRNNGDGTFSDHSEDFPFVDGQSVVAAVRFDLVADEQGFDLAVAYGDGTATLYRDRLGGRYEAEVLAGMPADTRQLLAADVDHDGWTDLLAVSGWVGGSAVTLLRNDQQDGLVAETIPTAVPTTTQPSAAVALVDVHGRGAGDLIVASSVLSDLGGARFESIFERTDELPVPPGVTGPTAIPTAMAAADFDADGRTDLAAVWSDGTVEILTNATETTNGSLRIALLGTKNPKLADGAEIEVKAGSLYQKQLYRGVPLVFGLGGKGMAEAVRITWPNGLIQNEVRQPAGTSRRYEEAQRLSGSCPMIYTWNGEEYVFITDILGVAPLGASAGDGEYFPVDHDEVVQIPGEYLAVRSDGTLDIRITEELREVAYLDQVRLRAVDHPEEVEILTNVKFQGPPFPELELYGVRDKHHPIAARLTTSGGRDDDVLTALQVRDASYPKSFERELNGLAELHHLELDFGAVTQELWTREDWVRDLDRDLDGGRWLLVLTGWVDWADGSTFIAASQDEGPGLVLPYLEAQGEGGQWLTVIEDLGLPAGKTKTIVADLTGKLPAGTRRLRITTSACVYWDEITLAAEVVALPAKLTDVPSASASLRFRGFARPVIHPQRLQPERFVYADRRPLSMWNPTPGLYTRYGDVAELVAVVDDRLVIMGSGDELALRFDASTLSPLAPGWRRDFLLAIDGWAKDGDANTAHSQSVEPLPYHGMPRYPYQAPHQFPDGAEHRLYREHYLTRPALRPIQPLRPVEAPGVLGAREAPRR